MSLDIIENIHSNLMFAPTKDVVSLPEHDSINHEEIFIDTPDEEKLHGYFLPAKEKTKNTMLYLHGNADNVSSWYTSCVEIQKGFTSSNISIYGMSIGGAIVLELALRELFL